MASASDRDLPPVKIGDTVVGKVTEVVTSDDGMTVRIQMNDTGLTKRVMADLTRFRMSFEPVIGEHIPLGDPDPEIIAYLEKYGNDI